MFVNSHIKPNHLGISTNLVNNPADISGTLTRTAHGFPVVELEMENAANTIFDLDEQSYYKRISDILTVKQLTGINIIVHAPHRGRNTNLAAADTRVRESAVERMLQVMEFSYLIGARMLTINPGYLESNPELAKRQLQYFKDSLCVLVARARSLGIQLCLANPRAGRPKRLILSDAQIIELCREFSLRYTFDVIDFINFDHLKGRYFMRLRKLLPYIGNVHVADMKMEKRTWMPLGKGNFPFHDVLSFLSNHGYNGNVIVTKQSFEDDGNEYIKQAHCYRQNLSVLNALPPEAAVA